MSSVWLAGLAYAVILCCDRLANAWNVPAETLGLTLVGGGGGKSRM